jgi:hypothetical protein
MDVVERHGRMCAGGGGRAVEGGDGGSDGVDEERRPATEAVAYAWQHSRYAKCLQCVSLVNQPQ